MARTGGISFVGCVFLAQAGGCSNTSTSDTGTVDNGGAPAESGGIASTVGGSTAQTGARAGIAQGGIAATSGGSANCAGTLDEVSSAWGQACPATFCEARSWARASCAVPLPAVVFSTESRCGTWNHRIDVVFGATHGKTCYYGSNSLVAAAAWDDVATYCNRTSARIVAGADMTACTNATSSVLCHTSGVSGAAGAGQGGTTSGSSIPDANCYNSFAGTCTPCCTEPNPDCTGRADSYPGYACTPPVTYSDGTPGNSFCACQCLAGQWRCAC